MQPGDKVYYCDNCSMEHRWPLSSRPIAGQELAGGYCHICGHGGMYAGSMRRDDPRLKDVKIFYEQEVESHV